jgi:hypothetical protein
LPYIKFIVFDWFFNLRSTTTSRYLLIHFRIMDSNLSYQMISSTGHGQGSSYAADLVTSGISGPDLPERRGETLEISGQDLLNHQETFSSGDHANLEATPFHESQDVLKLESMFYRKDLIPSSSPPFLKPVAYEEPLSFREGIDLSSEAIKQPDGFKICAVVATQELIVRPEDIVSMVIDFPKLSSLPRLARSKARSQIFKFFHCLFKQSFKKLQNLKLSNIELENVIWRREPISWLNLDWLCLDNPIFELGTFGLRGFKRLCLVLTSDSCDNAFLYIPPHIDELYIHICDQHSSLFSSITLANCTSLKNM